MTGDQEPRKKKIAPSVPDPPPTPSAPPGVPPAPDTAAELRRRAEERLAVFPAAAASPLPEDPEAIAHEPRVHQIELEMQSEELRRAQLELQASHDKRFDLAPVGYLTLSEAGIVEEANLTAGRLLGGERQDLVGRPFHDFVFAADQDVFCRQRKQLAEYGRAVDFELRLKHAGGEPLWASLQGKPMGADEDGPLRIELTFADVSARHRAEDDLRASEARLGFLVDQTSTVNWTLDSELRFTSLRGGGLKALRLEPDQVVGRHVGDYLGALKAQADPGAPLYERALAGDTFVYEQPLGELTFDIRLGPLRDANGAVVGVIGAGYDVTERKRAEQEIQTILRTTIDGYYLVDADGRFLDTNESYCAMIGFSRDELLAMSVKDIEAVETEGVIGKRIQRIMEAGHDRFETRHVRKDGSLLEIEASVTLLKGAQPKIVCFMRDIGERKQAEAALRESEAKYREVVEHTSDGIVIVAGAEGRVALTHQAFALMSGYAVEELTGIPFLQFVAAEQRAMITEQVRRQLAGEEAPADEEIDLLRKDGTRFSGESRSTAISFRGAAAGLVVLRDVTQSKRAAEQMHIKDWTLASTVDGVAITDLAGRATYLNPAMLKMWGFDAAEAALGKPVTEFWQDPQAAAAVIAALQEQGSWTGEASARGADGATFPVAVSLSLVRDENGEAVCMMGSFRDVSARRRSEQLLEALNAALLAMAHALSRDEAMHALAQELGRLGMASVLFTVADEGAVLIPQYLSYPEKRLAALEKLTGTRRENYRLAVADSPLYERVVGARESCYVEDAASELKRFFPARLRRLTGKIVAALGASQMISVPVLDGEAVIAVLSVQARQLSAADVPAITAFAQAVAATWRRTELYEQALQEIAERQRAEQALAQRGLQLDRALSASVSALSATTELRDPYTAGHQRRVAEFAGMLAAQLGWPVAQIETLRTAALLHDIGKVVVPIEILSKPGRLNAAEMELIRGHAAAGAEAVAAIEFEGAVSEIIGQHHERPDGSGYPQHLAGEAILPEARLLAVADVVEAMVSHRPYRPALPLETVISEIEEGAGTRYDAAVAGACLELLRAGGFALSPA